MMSLGRESAVLLAIYLVLYGVFLFLFGADWAWVIVLSWLGFIFGKSLGERRGFRRALHTAPELKAAIEAGLKQVIEEQERKVDAQRRAAPWQ